jgi:hypothetical protein
MSAVIFQEAAAEIAKLVAEKNEAYGSAFDQAGEILKILYPNGIKPDQMHNALAIVRVLDKFFRIANKENAFGENPWKDVMGYALLSVTRNDRSDAIEEEKKHAGVE